MEIIFRDIKPTYMEIYPDWSNISSNVVKAGTPMSAAGVIANNGNAVGIAAYDIGETNPNKPASLIVSGVVSLANVQTSYGSNLTDACKRALDEITFIKADGTVDTTSSSAPSIATATVAGIVKVGSGLAITSEGVLSADGITPAANQAASEATTVAGVKEDLNALLTKLKTAGLMVADSE